MAYKRHAQPFNRFRGPCAKRMMRAWRSSGVTTRAQGLIEHRVVAVNIGLVFGGQLLAGACGLDLGLSALAIEGVELRPDRAAGLSRSQRCCPRIAAEIVALRAPGERGNGPRRGH